MNPPVQLPARHRPPCAVRCQKPPASSYLKEKSLLRPEKNFCHFWWTKPGDRKSRHTTGPALPLVGAVEEANAARGIAARRRRKMRAAARVLRKARRCHPKAGRRLTSIHLIDEPLLLLTNALLDPLFRVVSSNLAGSNSAAFCWRQIEHVLGHLHVLNGVEIFLPDHIERVAPQTPGILQPGGPQTGSASNQSHGELRTG